MNEWILIGLAVVATFIVLGGGGFLLKVARGRRSPKGSATEG